MDALRATLHAWTAPANSDNVGNNLRAPLVPAIRADSVVAEQLPVDAIAELIPQDRMTARPFNVPVKFSPAMFPITGTPVALGGTYNLATLAACLHHQHKDWPKAPWRDPLSGRVLPEPVMLQIDRRVVQAYSADAQLRNHLDPQFTDVDTPFYLRDVEYENTYTGPIVTALTPSIGQRDLRAYCELGALRVVQAATIGISGFFVWSLISIGEGSAQDPWIAATCFLGAAVVLQPFIYGSSNRDFLRDFMSARYSSQLSHFENESAAGDVESAGLPRDPITGTCMRFPVRVYQYNPATQQSDRVADTSYELADLAWHFNEQFKDASLPWSPLTVTLPGSRQALTLPLSLAVARDVVDETLRRPNSSVQLHDYVHFVDNDLFGLSQVIICKPREHRPVVEGVRANPAIRPSSENFAKWAQYCAVLGITICFGALIANSAAKSMSKRDQNIATGIGIGLGVMVGAVLCLGIAKQFERRLLGPAVSY